ncbi:ABC-type transport system [Caenispirillum salinarum AK4]|uniref:ABC-type transport system n=1 Tax=Caenispirillum salinarum AK4 TaxID=1238182 RepID=K9GQI1_9PROT|nr:ABC transporter substrate-binding protein [Caenispirillum salinarum]EKV28220.1 ABC-type transport system [Caenispirillum salinarum AK4]
MIRRFLAPLFLLLAVAVVAQPNAARAEITPEQGMAFIENIANKGINEVIAADVPQQEKTQRFRDMFLANFGTESTARFVLGRHSRGADPEQLDRFQQLFREYNVLIWARRFDEYNGQELKVTGTRPDDDKGLFVESQVVNTEGGEPINIVWRLREREGGPKVVDIIVEGVSMALTYRSEYDAIISRSGLSGLNDQLAQKVQELKGG